MIHRPSGLIRELRLFDSNGKVTGAVYFEALREQTNRRDLKAAGAATVWSDPVVDSRGGAHSRGTCRLAYRAADFLVRAAKAGNLRVTG